jgi:hypothetical protein
MSDTFAVQGFLVDSFTVKGDTIKVILKGLKDDIRSGTRDLGETIHSLEVCSTAGEDFPINCTLLNNSLETTTYRHPFIVVDFLVKQDCIKLKLEAVSVENGTPLNGVAKSLTIHAQAGESSPVELVLPVS